MSWERNYFLPSDQSAFAYFVIFGEFDTKVSISASEYNFTSVPDNTDIEQYHDNASPEFRDGFKSGYLWNELCEENKELADLVASSSACTVIRAELEDQKTLDYLRNIIGLVTYFLDNGGVSVYEPQRFKWWDPKEWKNNVFQKREARPYEHTVVLVSEQEDGRLWYHTRGLRLFARPDISVHDVTPEDTDKVHEMINRFIEFQALGGLIEDGKKIKMEGLPSSMWCEHRGDEDDPDFNNRHVEIHWS